MNAVYIQGYKGTLYWTGQWLLQVCWEAGWEKPVASVMSPHPTPPKGLNTGRPSYFFVNVSHWFAHNSILPHEGLLLSALYCGKGWGRMAGMRGTSPASGQRGKAQALSLQKQNAALCLGHLPPLSNPQYLGTYPAASCNPQHSLGIPRVYSTWPSLLWTSLFPHSLAPSEWQEANN